MKRNEIRALAEQAYTILDGLPGEVAVERALAVLANAPEDPESYLLMSEVVGVGGHFDQALQWIERGLLQHRDHEGLLLKKASILIDGFEDIDEAFPILVKLVSSFKSRTIAELIRDLGRDLLLDIYLLLVDCHRLKSHYLQAQTYSVAASEIAPSDERALLALATAQFELGNYAEALDIIESVDRWNDISDFFWLLAHINCAEGDFRKADEAFLKANKIEKMRYYCPIRMSDDCFSLAYEQALLALPREIREFVLSSTVLIRDIVPLEVIKNSQGTLSPTACITVAKLLVDTTHTLNVITLYRKNIENLAAKKEEVKDLIASALLHELGKLIRT